jgi:hypothetical protein
MVGVFANHRFQPPGVEEFGLVGLHMQHDLGAALSLFDHLQRVVALSCRFPAYAMFLRQAGAPRGQRDTVGDDEAGIEADAELADQLRILLLVAAELAEELARTGFGDGADVFDDFLPVHADAVVANRDGFCILVDADPNLQFGIGFEQRGIGQCLEAQLVGGIGGIRDQFAQEDFLVAVQGMNHQLQELLDLGLKAQGLFAGGAVGNGFAHGPLSLVENREWL